MKQSPNHYFQPGSYGVVCPVGGTQALPPEERALLAPVLAYLEANDWQSQDTVFPKGTIRPDGRLDLCKQSIGPAGARLVTESLRQNTHIRHLLLGTNGIGDAGAAALVPLVAENTSLQTLYLGCNYIQPPGIALLCDALALNKSVEGLWLKRNPLGDAGLSHVARLLEQNYTIRILDLVNTQLGPEGLQQLVDVLVGSRCTVERLYLGGNQLTPESAPLLARLLTESRTLTGLLLNVNRLGDTGCLVLAEALQKNTTLIELGLASNGAGETGVIALLKAIEGHPSLQVVDLGYSPSTRVLGAQPNELNDRVAEVLGDYLVVNDKIRSLNLLRHAFTNTGFAHLVRGLKQNTSLQKLVIDGKPPAWIREFAKGNDHRFSLTTDPAVAAIKSVYR